MKSKTLNWFLAVVCVAILASILTRQDVKPADAATAPCVQNVTVPK